MHWKENFSFMLNDKIRVHIRLLSKNLSLNVWCLYDLSMDIFLNIKLISKNNYVIMAYQWLWKLRENSAVS